MIPGERELARLRNGVLLSSAAAWVLLGTLPEPTCHGSAALGSGLAEGLSLQALGSAGLGWLVMLVAMMAPVTLPALNQIRMASFARRRWCTSGVFLAGYAAVWMAAGVLLWDAGVVALHVLPGSYLPAGAVAGIALVWQASPLKQRCLNRCHRHRSLGAFGLAAVRDAALVGLGHGLWCVGSGWALMLFPMLLPEGHLLGMALVTPVMICERLDPPARPAWRLRGFRTALRWLRLRGLGPRASPPPHGWAAPARAALAGEPVGTESGRLLATERGTRSGAGP